MARDLHYDKATFVVLNYLLLSFGLRLKSDHSLVYSMRSCDYVVGKQDNEAPVWIEIIPIQTDIPKVFEFLGLNHDAFELGFNNIFEYSDFLSSSPYVTPSFLRVLDDQLSKPTLTADQELVGTIKKVVTHIKLGQPPSEVSRKKSISTTILFMFHKNMKEKVVRKYFQDNVFEDKVREVKRRRLPFLAKNKIAKNKILEWFPLLSTYPELHGMFMVPFINYMTDNDPRRFPGYLADSEVTEIRRDMLDFYNDIFVNSPEVNRFLYGQVEKEA